MRPSSEALLVSALVNSQDTTLGLTYGVEPDMLIGYQPEYRWVMSYEKTYNQAPSRDALLSRFPDFPYAQADDAAFAADEVRALSNQRNLRSCVRNAALHIGEGDYDEAAMALSEYTPAARGKPAVNALYEMSFLDGWQDKPDSLVLPWKTLQSVTGGIRPGDLWYLAARLGQGKSWSATEIVAKSLMDGRNVNFYSLEMPKKQVLTRMHVALGQMLGIPVDHVAMRDKVCDVIAYRKLANRIRDEVPGLLYIFDSSDGRVTPATVGSRAGDADLSVIDYTGLMASPLGRRAVDDWRVIAAISNELKEVAVGKNTRVLALSQINREGDTTSRFPPKVKHLAQSDSLGQDGDVVLTHKQYGTSAMIYSVEKNRHGGSGVYFYTRFLPNEGRFQEISRDAADDLRDRETDDDVVVRIAK